MKWPWCPLLTVKCCSGTEQLAAKVAERYIAAGVEPPGDLSCRLTLEEWAALIRDAASYYDIVGEMPAANLESLYASLRQPWYRWEAVLNVDHNIGHFDFGVGTRLGSWAIPQFVNCYPLVDWKISAGSATLGRFMAVTEAKLSRGTTNTYLRCSEKIPFRKGRSSVGITRDKYVRFFVVGNVDAIGFYDEKQPKITTPKPTPIRPRPEVVPSGVRLQPESIPQKLPLRVADNPILPTIDSTKSDVLTKTVWSKPFVKPPNPPAKAPTYPPGSYVADADSDLYINGAIVPYLGPWYYDVTDWLHDGSNIINAGTAGQIVAGVYYEERVNVVRVGCKCYYAVGLRNWLKHITLFERADFTVSGLKKVV